MLVRRRVHARRVTRKESLRAAIRTAIAQRHGSIAGTRRIVDAIAPRAFDAAWSTRSRATFAAQYVRIATHTQGQLTVSTPAIYHCAITYWLSNYGGLHAKDSLYRTGGSLHLHGPGIRADSVASGTEPSRPRRGPQGADRHADRDHQGGIAADTSPGETLAGTRGGDARARSGTAAAPDADRRTYQRRPREQPARAAGRTCQRAHSAWRHAQKAGRC